VYKQNNKIAMPHRNLKVWVQLEPIICVLAFSQLISGGILEILSLSFLWTLLYNRGTAAGMTNLQVDVVIHA
jgi:hypothetical protein